MWQSIENELAAADQYIDRGSLDAMQDFQLHWKAVKLMITPLWHANPQAPWVTKSQKFSDAFETIFQDAAGRQTFSRNAITLSTSASLGSLSSGSPGFARGEPGAPGSGSPRPKSSFFSVAFSPCRRAISASSAERSSGTTLQAQPASLRLHCETWPVRVSSRSTPSATGLKL